MRISEHDFANEDVVLDFHEFDHCTFKNCRLIINGYGPFTLGNCHFDSPKFVFGGAAAITLSVMTQMYQGGFQEIIEPTLDNIRKGIHPKG